tara:strand:- start:688 stop:2715 length:2028 start_codon:yes stop_codon:yes gene_type:complete
MADGDEEKTEGSIDSNTVNSLNDSISLLVNNLNNLNSAVNDQAKVTSKASDVMTDASKAAEGLGEGVKGFENKADPTATKKKSKLGSVIGGIGSTGKALLSFGESLKNVQDRYVNDPKLNYFQKARRAEQLASIKSLISFRSALKNAVSALMGFITKGIKVAYESFTGMAQTAAGFGVSMDKVADFKTMTKLTNQGISYNEAAEGIQSAIKLGFDPTSASIGKLIVNTNMLGQSFKQYAGIAKRLSLITGLSKDASVNLMHTTMMTARQYGLDSEKLVQSIQELIPTLQKVALAQGAQAGASYTEAISLLTAKLGPEFEQLAADVLQGVHGGKSQSFVMASMLGVDSKGLEGGSAGGVVSTLESMSVALLGMLNNMKSENGYNNTVAVSILSETFKVSQNQMHSLIRMGEALELQSSLTPAEIAKQEELLQETMRTNNAMTALNTITQAIFVAIGQELYPFIKGFGAWAKKNGEAIKDWIIYWVKLIPSLFKTYWSAIIDGIVILKMVLLGMGGMAAAMNLKTALHQTQVVGLLRGIYAANAGSSIPVVGSLLGALGAISLAAGTLYTSAAAMEAYGAYQDFKASFDASGPDSSHLKDISPLSKDIAESVASIDDKTKDLDRSKTITDVLDNGQMLANQLQQRVLAELRKANQQRREIEDDRSFRAQIGALTPLG